MDIVSLFLSRLQLTEHFLCVIYLNVLHLLIFHLLFLIVVILIVLLTLFHLGKKLLFYQFSIQIDAPMRNVYEHAQIVKHVAQSQKILGVCLTELFIVQVFEKILDPDVIYYKRSDDLFLWELKKHLDHIWIRYQIIRVPHYFKELQTYATV